MKESIKNFDNRLEMLNRLVNVAKENALDKEHYEILISSLDVAEARYSKGETRKDIYENKIKSFFDRVAPATIHINNLYDFKKVLEILGLEGERLHSMLNHENAHANKAEAMGQNFLGYKITVVKDIDGLYYFYPYVAVNTYGDIKETNTILKEITKAPEEAGDKLSEGDIALLETKD